MDQQDNHDGLPRVKIKESTGSWTVGVNFGVSTVDNDKVSDIVRELIELSDDWTAYCISTLKYSPSMYSFGQFMVSQEIGGELLTYLRQACISSEESPGEAEGENNYSFIIHHDDLLGVGKKLETTDLMLRAARSVVRANLSSTVAEFDFLLIRFLTIVSKHKPEIFITGNESIPLAQLMRSGSIDEIVEAKVQEKIEDKLRASHSDTISWIAEVLELSNPAAIIKSDVYKDFIEVCQRRHILVHNGGVVNKQYLDKCVQAGVDQAQLPKLGETVDIGVSYLRRSAARAYLVGLFLIHLYLQKQGKLEQQSSHQCLLATSHDFLEEGMTKMASRVIDFAEHPSAKLPNDLKLKFGINRALSALLDPKKEKNQQNREARKVLKEYDWSVTDPVFDLALACVRRDFSNIISLAKAANEAGLKYADASTFCVFREAREIEGFIACFPRTPLMLEGASEAQQ